jgi:hypothetical protein
MKAKKKTIFSILGKPYRPIKYKAKWRPRLLNAPFWREVFQGRTVILITASYVKDAPHSIVMHLDNGERVNFKFPEAFPGRIFKKPGAVADFVKGLMLQVIKKVIFHKKRGVVGLRFRSSMFITKLEGKTSKAKKLTKDFGLLKVSGGHISVMVKDK